MSDELTEREVLGTHRQSGGRRISDKRPATIANQAGSVGVSLATSLRKMWFAQFRITLATEYTEGTESHER
jgi:hypothetical protein